MHSQLLFSKIFESSGNVLATVGSLSPSDWRSAGCFIAAPENLSLEKSVFENISAPLAMSGTPWESARERVEHEIRFWFGEKSPLAFPSAPAGALSAEERVRLALAHACAAVEGNAALVVPENLLLTDSVFEKLRERARAENFTVVLENARCANFARADDFFLSGKSATNVFRGKILGAGAGEFFAEISDGAQIHGKLCGNVPEEIPEGAEIEIFLPPEIFHTDAFPPEENCFELAKGSEISFDGRLFFREFGTRSDATVLRVAARHRQSLEIPEGGTLYAWFFPEDAVGKISLPLPPISSH